MLLIKRNLKGLIHILISKQFFISLQKKIDLQKNHFSYFC